MRTWGQALIAISILNAITGKNPESVFPGLLVGAYLWINGQKRLDLLQALADQVLSIIRDESIVVAYDLSQKFGVSEAQLRLKIVRAQKKGWLPKEIDII